MVDAGLSVIAAFISPFRGERRMARDLLAEGEFIELFVDAPLAVAEARDPKKLYVKAPRGEIPNFTGIDSPYERPEAPELRIDTTTTSPHAAAELIVEELRGRGILQYRARNICPVSSALPWGTGRISVPGSARCKGGIGPMAT